MPHDLDSGEQVSTTKVRRPQSNGYVERLHRTLLDEHFRVMGRTKFYEGVDEMQIDLDAYLVSYNTKRPHQGRNMNGRTPIKVFLEGLPKTEKGKEEKTKKAAQTIPAPERQVSGDNHLCTRMPYSYPLHKVSRYHSQLVHSLLRRDSFLVAL